jgi:hypothetical protein
MEDTKKQRFATELLPGLFQQRLKGAKGFIPEYVYTDFNEDAEGFKVNIDFKSYPAVARAWYTRKILELLAPETSYHSCNFINDPQFWTPDEGGSNMHMNCFHKFTLRVQNDFITGRPELLISYDGCSYIGKKSLEELGEEEDMEPRLVKTVAFRKRIYRYDDLPDEALYARHEFPWRLEGTEKPELVIGFGAYRNRGFNMGYTGSAFCFSQDGIFREFDVFPAENTRSIAGSALKAFKQYRENYPGTQRMIIHFYKPMSRKELEPIEKMLREMKMDSANHRI